MNDKHTTPQAPTFEPSEKVRELRALHEYIEISLWDEKMNRVREYWLWERKETSPSTNSNHYYKGDNDYENV